MDTEKSTVEAIKEEVELARALTALLMAVKLHCAEQHTPDSQDPPPTQPDDTRPN